MSNKLLRPKESVDRGFLYYLFLLLFYFRRPFSHYEMVQISVTTYKQLWQTSRKHVVCRL